MRIDRYLVDCDMCATRSEAQRAVRDGRVTVDGSIIFKCAYEVTEGASVCLSDGGCPYVSRGGEKLAGAIRSFGINIQGVTALDVGASTGGFTDCLLQHGADYVFALENGCGQLHEKLQNDKRVCNMEHTNARYITKDLFSVPITFVTMDVSFISQKLILPAIYDVLLAGGSLVTLIKPQFEVGRGYVGKGGIVKDAKARERAVKEVCDFAETLGFVQRGVTESPILGGDGNTEYLAYFVKQRGDLL